MRSGVTMEYKKLILAFLLIAVTLTRVVWCFKASCLNGWLQRAWLCPTNAQVFYGFAIPPTAESLPSDSLTILQCTEDEVTIEWSIQNDLKFVAFEYSCIHPTNSTLTVRNQSLPYWNDGQTGVTMVSPPGGALCLFSACYLDNYNSRHFIAPTSCSVSPPTATQDGSSVPEQSITQQTMTSSIDLVPSPTTTPDGSISLRVRRGSLHLQQIGAAIIAAVAASIGAAACILTTIQLKRRRRNKEGRLTVHN
ncbi:hypothetical protein EMCRGX_G023184 [Ephydatia muelleri]